MREVFLDFGLKLVSAVAPWIVRRFYKVEKIIKGVKIRVVDGGQGIRIHGGELPCFKVWLRITNLTPFTLTFDRVYGDLYHGCKLTEFKNLDCRTVPTASETEFMVEASLSPDHVAFIRRNVGQKFDTYLMVNTYVHSRLHDFAIEGREVRTRNVEWVNFAPEQGGATA